MSHLVCIQSTLVTERCVEDMLRPMTFPFLRDCSMPFTRTIISDYTLHASANILCKMYRCIPDYSYSLFPPHWNTFGTSLACPPQPRSEEEQRQIVNKE
ncbi:hypothetical protein TNCV_3971251 [Trichonephila clavipes]|nr:hypothetical protein TNCV_3971251 [Trichonephila clavipes]